MSDKVEDFFAHYGVKGMKWGVRRSDAQLSKARGKSEMSEDAEKAANARIKAKTSGTSSLSNKEMQTLVNRMNLEQQYSRLNPSKVSRGLSTTKTIVGAVGTISSVIALANSPTGQLVKKTLKK